MPRLFTTSLCWLAALLTAAVVSGSAACSKSGARSSPSSSAPASQQASASVAPTRQLAAQPGPVYASILGPSSIDDGLSGLPDPGHAVASALSAVADAFGSGEQPSSSSSSSSASS